MFFTFTLVLQPSWTTKAETSANKKLVGAELLHRLEAFGVDSLGAFSELSRSGSGLGVPEDRLQCQYVSQGAFSYINALASEGLWSQINYAKWKWFGIVIEYCEDPHPRNSFWYMWGMPNFDIMEPEAVIYEMDLCRQAYPWAYIKVCFYDCRIGSESCGFSHIAHRPKSGEASYVLVREEGEGRRIRYSIVPAVAAR